MCRLWPLTLLDAPGPWPVPFVYLMWLTVCLPSRSSQALLSASDLHWWETRQSVSFPKPGYLAHSATYCQLQIHTHERTWMYKISIHGGISTQLTLHVNTVNIWKYTHMLCCHLTMFQLALSVCTNTMTPAIWPMTYCSSLGLKAAALWG